MQINHGVANLDFSLLLLQLCLFGPWRGERVGLYNKERIMPPCLTTYIISMVILAFSKKHYHVHSLLPDLSMAIAAMLSLSA